MADNIRKILEEYKKERKEKIFFIVGTLIFWDKDEISIKYISGAGE